MNVQVTEKYGGTPRASEHNLDYKGQITSSPNNSGSQTNQE